MFVAVLTAEPESIQLYVDDMLVEDKARVTFDTSEMHTLRCRTEGSFPQTTFRFSLGPPTDLASRFSVLEHTKYNNNV